MCGTCGDGWRFEATDLATGRVKAVLHPISADWEDALCQPSTASLVLATQDPSADDVFATETGLFISRVLDDYTREPFWGGYIENTSGEGGGTLTVAAVSMDGYLSHRLLADDDGGLRMDIIEVGIGQPTGVTVWKPVDTTPANDVMIYRNLLSYIETAGVAYTLVVMTQPRGMVPNGNGIPLEPNMVAPVANNWPDSSNAGWEWWDFKNIGQAIREMVEASPGLKYWVEHAYSDGYWSSVINFSDEIGTVRDYTLRSDYEGWQYGLRVDGKDKASRVYGIGGGTEENTQFSVAYDQDERKPEFMATVSWKDQTNPTIIDKMTAGYVTDHRDPVAVPAMTLIGLPSDADPGTGYPGPDNLKPGDKFEVDIGYGAITVRDIQVKCLGISSKLEQGKPLQRVIAMLPVVRPSESIKTQTPARALEVPAVAPIPDTPGARTVTPWPRAGLVTRIHPNNLHEISGTQYSEANPGHIWVHNDNEVSDLGVIYLVNVIEGHPDSGNITGRFEVGPLVGTSDFEAIRMRPGSTDLYIGDVGDNGHVRTNGFLHKLTEPVGGGNKGKLPTQRTTLQYPFGGGWVNTESLLVHPLTDEILTITKENNRARVVSFGVNPTGTVMGTLVAVLDDVDFVVDATHTHDGNWVFIRTNHNDATFVYNANSWGKRVAKIATPPMPKGEGITIENRCAFLVTTEAEPHAPINQTETPVYRVLIPEVFGAVCGTPEGPSGTGGTGGQAPDGTIPGQVLDLTNWKLTLPVN